MEVQGSSTHQPTCGQRSIDISGLLCFWLHDDLMHEWKDMASKEHREKDAARLLPQSNPVNPMLPQHPLLPKYHVLLAVD